MDVKKHKTERNRINTKIGGFNSETSKAYKLIEESLGQVLIQNELIQLAELFQKVANPPFAIGRDEKRCKQLMYKYFSCDEIYPLFKDFISKLAIKTSDKQVKGPKAEEYLKFQNKLQHSLNQQGTYSTGVYDNIIDLDNL